MIKGFNELTQKEKVLKYMQEKGYITTRDAGINLEVWDLQSNIRDLKNDGITIYSAWVQNIRTKATYKVYALHQKYIDAYKRKFGNNKIVKN